MLPTVNKKDHTDQIIQNSMSITISKEDHMDLKIKNPCIEEFIPLKIEKGSILSHPNNADKLKIRDKSLDDNATFYRATIKLGDSEIGEFHTRYVVHWGIHANDSNIKHVTNFFNPMKSFESNRFSWAENWISYNEHNKFFKLVKEGKDYVFKWCNRDGGGITNDARFIFPSKLVNFNKDYIKDLSDLNKNVDSVYLIARAKLYKHFNDMEDYLHSHPVEIREFSVKGNNIATGKLIGTLNHEYGVFREFADGDKREFIFSDVITKGKDIIANDKDSVSYPDGKVENPKVFLFLAKYKSNSDVYTSDNCLDRPYNNHSELKAQKYMLGFVNEKGCTKMISNVHLHEGTDLEKLFADNQDKAIPVYPRTPDMVDVWDMVQCVANPIGSDSTFI